MRSTTIAAVYSLLALTCAARELHVSVHGDDANAGSQPKPLRTIMAAARLAQPGDFVTVHEGTYREFARILACVWPTTVFVTELAFAQKPPLRIEIGPSVRVTDSGAPHVEPYIAAHPEDARNLIVTVTHLSGEQEGIVETFSTADGGRTWSGASLPQLRDALARKEMAAPVVDSWATYAPDGTRIALWWRP